MRRYQISLASLSRIPQISMHVVAIVSFMIDIFDEPLQDFCYPFQISLTYCYLHMRMLSPRPPYT